MSFSLHHFIHSHEVDQEKHERLHAKRYVRFIDKAVYLVAIFGPLMTIPQVLTIWISQNAEDVSLLTWVLYTLTAIFWLLYGIAHRNKPIIISNILWVAMEIPVIVGTIIY